MKIKYKLDLEDIIIFNQHHYENSPATVKIRIKIKYSVLIVIFLISGLLAVIYQSILVLAFGTLLAFLFSLIYPPKVSKIFEEQVRNQYSEGANKRLICIHQLEICDLYLRESSDSGSQETNYSSIEKIVSTETHTFIYIASVIAHIVPRAKVLEGSLDDFVEAVRLKVESQSS